MPEELKVIPEEIWEKNLQYKKDMKLRYHQVLGDTYDFCMENGLEFIFKSSHVPAPRKNKPSLVRRRT
jgi:hypothetical protein